MVEEPQTEAVNIQTDSTVARKKFSLIRVLILLLSLFFITIVVCEALGWPFLRAPVEQFASKQLERTVKIDAPFNLKLLGGVQLNVGGLYISAPKTFDAAHFIETKNIVLNLRYSDLFNLKKTNQLRIKSLRVNQIDAQLLRKADGSATWQFSDDENKPDSPFPIFETLIVQSGSAKIVDPKNQLDLAAKFYTNEGAAHANIVSNNEVALSKNEMVLDKKVALNQVDLNQVHLNKKVSPNQPVSSKNSVASGIEIQGKFSKKAIKGKLTTDGFLPIATHDKNSAPIASTAWVEFGGLRADFIGTVSDLFGKHDVKGKLSVKGPSLAVLGQLVNVVLPTTDKFYLSTMLEKDDQVWIAKSVNSHVGNSDLNGNFTYDPRPIRPLLKGNFGGKRFFLADLAPAFGTKNADGSIATPDNGKALPDRPLDLPSLNKMDAQIEVNLAYVDLGNAFSRPISPLKADLVLDSGKLSLSKIDARTADGGISGLISIDTHLANVVTKSPTNQNEADKSTPSKALTTPENDKIALNAVQKIPPTWNINLRWKDIDVEKWLTVSTDPQRKAVTDGKKETPPSYVTGTLNGKTKLTGRGNSTAEMLSSLDGDVSIFMQKGTISHLIVEAVGLDIAQALGILLTKDNALPMNCAVMDLTAKNGVATPKIALVDTPVTLILIDGNVNIAKESLDLRMAAKPKNTSPFTVRSPIHVTGSFKKPDVSIEKTPIVARVLGSIALAFVAPPAAILPFIDVGSGDESPCNKSLQEFNEKL